MGGEKTTQATTSNATQTATATPEQTELNKLQLGQAQAFDPLQRQINQSGGMAINALLTGQPLPGYLSMLPGGISNDVTTGIVNQSLNDVNNSLAKSGAGTMLESGASQAIGARTAGDIRNQAAQFNLNNLLQLLNIGVGGQASVQQPMGTITGQLGGRLAGLNTINSSGTSNQTTVGMNPFLKSFQQSAGQSLGSGTFGNTGGWFAPPRMSMF